jgi:hypothetical protein
MRNIIFLLLCLILLGGCAGLTPLDGVEKEEFHTFYLTVTSTPSDANIYINDMLVGRTPSRSVPLHVKYGYEIYPLWKSASTPKENYILRVSKKGYKDAFENIRFTWRKGWSCSVPAKEEYHFDLEKIEQSSGTGI